MMFKEQDYFKIYNSKVGAIQFTPTKEGEFYMEFAKTKGVNNGQASYDFDNKITTSLSVRERGVILTKIKDFEKDAAKASRDNVGKDQFYIDIKPIEFPHLESKTPKNISFQRQVYKGAMQLIIAVKIIENGVTHRQSIDYVDTLVFYEALRESIILSVYARVNIANEMRKYKVNIDKESFVMELPKDIGIGDIISDRNGILMKVDFKMYDVKSKSWSLYLKKRAV